MSAGTRQKCRLFLEGREVPFVSASISSSVGQPTMATIDLVPEETIKFIRPKTSVHLFVQDSHAFGDQNFYLAFEGEVVGRQMGKSQSSRYFRVNCVDYSAYWDEAKNFFYNHNFLVAMFGQVQSGGMTTVQTERASGADKMTGAATLISQMIQEMLRGNNKDLLVGVVRIIKTMDKINLLYRTAWDRLRINDRIRAVSSGNIAAFLKDLQMEEFLKSYTGAHGGVTSLRETLLGILGLIFHEFSSIPFPSVVSTSSTGAIDLNNTTIGSFLFIPDGYSLPPPRCNVIFPSQIQSIDFVEDFRAAPTRFMFRASFPEGTDLGVFTYQTQYYPKSFSDYMFNPKVRDTTSDEYKGLLGPSQILTDGTNSYASLFYGSKSDKAVGKKSVSPKLRQADFLTNEESIRGIFLENETFAPAVTALMRDSSISARNAFTGEIGRYLFYKKRFSARNAEARLLFNPFVVPGFNAMLVDDSDAGQTLIAKVQSVTHTLNNAGCETSISLGYARDFNEVDALSGGAGDPPLPRWFDETKFGQKDAAAFKAETAYLKEVGVIGSEEVEARDRLSSAVCFTKLSSFYQSLIGCDSVTSIDGKDEPGFKNTKLCTTRGAAFFLISKYRAKSSSSTDRDDFVRKMSRRRVPTLAETYYFLGAEPVGENKIIPEEFAQFQAMTGGPMKGRFDGKGYPDEKILNFRREIIDKYIAVLKTKRGFRG